MGGKSRPPLREGCLSPRELGIGWQPHAAKRMASRVPLSELLLPSRMNPNGIPSGPKGATRGLDELIENEELFMEGFLVGEMSMGMTLAEVRQYFHPY